MLLLQVELSSSEGLELRQFQSKCGSGVCSFLWSGGGWWRCKHSTTNRHRVLDSQRVLAASPLVAQDAEK